MTIAIVGAGPAGASLALQLASAGIAVVLIEASDHAGGRFRGEALMPSGLQALEAFGLWPLPEQIPQRPLQGWRFFLDGRELFTVAEPLTGSRACTLIDPSALLDVMVERAAARPGFRLLRRRGAVDLIHEGDRVAAVVLADGSTVQADLVVACDGRRSLVRRRAGMEVEPGGSLLDVLWFELKLPAATAIARWLNGHFVTVVGDSGSYALFTKTAGGVQLGWAVEPARARSRDISAADWRALWADNGPTALAELLGEFPVESIDGPLRLNVRVGLARSWHRSGVLLLGDAAHPMSPLRAQGINMALRDSRVAADELMGLFAESAAPPDAAAIDGALQRIESRRRPEIQRIQQLQQREALRAVVLARQHGLRHLLSLSAGWLGPLLAQRWRHEQVTLREGLPGA